MLVGRKSYEGFAGFWPSQTGPWADAINPMPKYVASLIVMSGCGELARELIQAGLRYQPLSSTT
jgi:hypothetical protein